MERLILARFLVHFGWGGGTRPYIDHFHGFFGSGSARGVRLLCKANNEFVMQGATDAHAPSLLDAK